MKINGTIINYFFHCKRQCWLFIHRLNMEDNSEEVQMGRVLHENLKDSEESEIAVQNIKIDKITKQYVIEYKKSDADLNAAIRQLKYYLYLLKEKGITKEGRVEVIEKNKQKKKVHKVIFSEETKLEVESWIKEIEELSERECPPMQNSQKECSKCAYYEYCNL